MSNWFVEKLQRDRASQDAAAQAVGFANVANSQQIAAVRQKLNTTTAELNRTREVLELEQRRLDFLKGDWIGARDVIKELREALKEVCLNSPDPEIQAKVQEGGIFHKDSIIQRWNEYAARATEEEKNSIRFSN